MSLFRICLVISKSFLGGGVKQQHTWAQAASLLRFQEHVQDTPHSIGLFCTRDRPNAKPLPENTQHAKERGIYVTSGT